MSELILTDENFQKEVLETPGIKLVDFWAGWCYPCKMLAPIIDELTKEYEGKVVFGKLEVDENPVTSNNYSISGIPTVIIFKDGKEAERLVGVQTREVYQKALNGLTS